MFCIGVAIALVLVYWLATPYTRELFIYDATISYSDSTTTIPSWACFVVRTVFLMLMTTTSAAYTLQQVPFALLLINVGLVELAFRNAHGWTMAAAFFIHFVLQGLYCYLFTLLIAQITNFIVGYPRPEFLARCKPASTTFPSSFSANGPAQPVVCTNTNTGYVLDGLKSFPSGALVRVALPHACRHGVAAHVPPLRAHALRMCPHHPHTRTAHVSTSSTPTHTAASRAAFTGHAASSAVETAYVTVYTLWGLYTRPRSRLVHFSTRWQFFAWDLLHTAMLVWLMGIFAWCGVGVQGAALFRASLYGCGCAGGCTVEGVVARRGIAMGTMATRQRAVLHHHDSGAASLCKNCIIITLVLHHPYPSTPFIACCAQDVVCERQPCHQQ